MRVAILTLVLIGSIGTGQDQPANNEHQNGWKLFTDSAGRNYFPKGRASYYTEYLAAMKEPSILDPLPYGVSSVYRLTILPSFSDRITVRITNRQGVYEMRSVQLKCDTHHRPDKIVHDETKFLDEKTASPLIRLLSSEAFWTDFTDLEMALMQSVMDGETYVFEKRTAEGYTLIDPHTPSMVVRFVEKNPDYTKRDFQIFDLVAERLKNVAGLPIDSGAR